MTPDQKVVIEAALISATPATVLSAIIAYWTWRRDQERLVVQKSPVHWRTLDGAQTEETLCGLGIVVTNLSLFPVRVVALGFRTRTKDGVRFLLSQDQHKDDWPAEIGSHTRLVVYATDNEWTSIKALGLDKRIMDWGFVAVGITETGRRFGSNRFGVWVRRPLRFRRWFKGEISATKTQ